MFENLSQRLGKVFDRLRGRGALSEGDVDEALREVRLALLEADVALSVVKTFVAGVRLRAIGQEVIKSVTPGQMVVKIVHDHLVETLGSTASDINLRAVPPVPILMVGLQAGRTGMLLNRWVQGAASPGDIAFAITTFMLMSGYLRNIGENVRMMQKGLDDVEDVANYARMVPQVADAPAAPAAGRRSISPPGRRRREPPWRRSCARVRPSTAPTRTGGRP
jgi:ABC-type multidrug transport system fused ATPase/permease subunit